ncbi:MAG: RnfH family protein [Rhodanobacter sp.]|nr:RnfH family protein [Rhodanobacter sp.]
MIKVEVVCADACRQVVRRIELPCGSTVMQAIEVAGIADAQSGNLPNPARLGIFSRKVTPDHLVKDGDRIEIYRALSLDPMEARRKRARGS